jgi:NAD(P)-dependent dehydrogenase (short-subunit alcohol dehydrogenase family)
MTEKPVAVITAGNGAIGGACAREFAKRGYDLVLMSRSGAKEVAEETGALGIAGSVDDPKALKHLVATTIGRFGRIDVLINNSGHTRRKSNGELIWNRAYQGYFYNPDVRDDFMLEIEDEDWHAGLDLIMLNVVRTARLVVPIMREQGGGAVVNISSYVAKDPSLALPLGSSMRAALGTFTKLFADRYGRDNIRMNTVLPGHIENWPGGDRVVPTVPLGRSGGPDEVATATAFLAGSEAGYITGQSILVDGGRARGLP